MSSLFQEELEEVKSDLEGGSLAEIKVKPSGFELVLGVVFMKVIVPTYQG